MRIDAEGEDRTKFMIDTARRDLDRRDRARVDEEIGRIYADSAAEDSELLREFAPLMADGLDTAPNNVKKLDGHLTA